MEFTMQLRKTTSRTKTRSVKKSAKKLKSCKVNDKCLCTPITVTNFEIPIIWEEMRQKGQLCDGIIHCCDGNEIKVHRAILSAVSPYFRALFTNSINRGQPETYKATVDVECEIFNIILDYAYKGTCKLNNENVEDVLRYADRYEILGVVQLCKDFLINKLNPKNCIGIWYFANQYFCRNLIKRVNFYIRSNFLKILEQSKEFYDLKYTDLYNILCADELNVKSEEIVFRAIIQWATYDLEKRSEKLFELIQCVRIGILSNYELNKIIEHKIIQNREDCRNYLENIMQEIQCHSIDLKSIICTPRISFDVLFAIGGWSAGSPTNFVETYDVRADRWLLSSDTDLSPRAYHGVCVLHDLIYVIGGFDGNQHYNTIRRFNPVTHQWSECACMYHHRCYVSVVIHDEKIYAMGGYDGRVRTNTMERYDYLQNQWEMMPSMRNCRSDASAAVLNTKIYIVGGFNGQEVMKSAEVFDVSTNQWTYIPQMTSARSGVSLISYSNTLYALGGFDGTTRLTSIEKFRPDDPTTGWEEIGNMMTPRSNFAAVVLDDYIYVIGGFNGSTTINFVEYYNPETNEWFNASSMNLNRSALSACVVSGLPNIMEYSVLGKRHSHDNHHGKI